MKAKNMNNDDNTFDGIFGEDEVREVLRESFYSEAPKPLETRPKKKTKARGRKNKKPDHYDVICISLYKEDLARLDAKVRKMNRSALIRFALDTADLDALPRSY